MVYLRGNYVYLTMEISNALPIIKCINKIQTEYSLKKDNGYVRSQGWKCVVEVTNTCALFKMCLRIGNNDIVHTCIGCVQ